MANQISGIRNRTALLFGTTTVFATVLLLLAIPVLSDLTPQAVRVLRISCIVFGAVVLVTATALIQHYLRPISDLGYALEIGSTPAVDLARDARRIALNAPAYLFCLSTGGVLLLSLAYNLVAAAISPHHVFVAHLLPTLLSTVLTACGSLLVAFMCQRWMYPVLRYSATRFQTGGFHITVRTRILVVSVSLMLLAILLPGSYGIAQAIAAHREHRASATVHLLSAVVERLPGDGAPARLLEEAAGQLGASTVYQHLFLVDSDGVVEAQWPEDGLPLGFDGAAWSEELSSTFRRGGMDYSLVRVPTDAPSRWLGVGYALHPLESPRVRGMVTAVGGSTLLVVAMALAMGHHLSVSLTGALGHVSERLLHAAQEVPVDLGAALPVLSADEVGDLVLAYNALQGRVRAQLEEVERKQRQLGALQSLSYKIGTVRSPVYLLEEVIRDVERAFGYHNVSILIADETGQELRFAATHLTDEVLRRRRFRVGADGVVGHVAATREPLLVNDVSECEFYIPDGTNTRSELAVPLVIADRLLGVLNVSSERIGAFEENDLRIVIALANQVAIALENAHLRDEVVATTEAREWRARNRSILNDISSALSASLTQQDLLAMVAERLVALFGVEHCAIVLFNGDLSCGRMVAVYPPGDGATRDVQLQDAGPLAQALRAGRLLVYSEPQHRDTLAGLCDALQMPSTRAVLVAPLVTTGRVGGLIVLCSDDAARTFSHEERAVCQTIAAQVAVGVENARLLQSMHAQADARSPTVQRIPLDAILSSLADGLLVTDLSGRILFCNAALCSLLGQPADRLLGRSLSEIAPELRLYALEVRDTGEPRSQRVALPGGRRAVARGSLVHETEMPDGVVLVLREDASAEA